MKAQILLVSLVLACLLFTAPTKAQNEAVDKLVVVWTSDDPMLAERMVFMYVHNAKKAGWFKDVTLIIWGPSAKLTAENLKVQEQLKAMQDDGVELRACIACANAYGVADQIKNLGIEVTGMGKPLTDYLKSDAKVLTF